MRRSHASLLAAALLGCIGRALAVEPTTSDAIGLAHLVPCAPFVDMPNLHLVLRTRSNTLLGLEQPSAFDPRGALAFRMYVGMDHPPYTESVVSVYFPDNGDAVVESVEATKSIGQANTKPNKPEPTGKLVRIPVVKHISPLARDVAVKVSAALGRAMTQVRYPEDPGNTPIVLHGTVYVFVRYHPRYGDMCGETPALWADVGPGQLVEIGELLLGYGKQGEDQRGSIEKRIADVASAVP